MTQQEINALLSGFIRRAEAEKLPVEAIVWMQGETPVWQYRSCPDVPRNIYSHTKSFTGTAVGICIDEGLLHLTDRVVDFFPEYLPEGAESTVGQITLRDALTMSSGLMEPLLMTPERKRGVGAPDYLRFVLSHPLKAAPGSAFCYSNGDTYLAARMVEKVTGTRLDRFVAERVFRPLGIDENARWEIDPMGHTLGGSGLFLKCGDMCKLGVLYLQNGVYAGKRIVSHAWVDDARRVHIASNPNPHPDPDDWNCGYGYQCWNLPRGEAYQFNGAYGQYSLILPEHGAVIGVQCTENDVTGSITRALQGEVLSRLYD